MKTRKILSLLTALALMLTAAFSLVACGQVESEGKVTVVIEERDGGYDVYEIDLADVGDRENGVAGVLEALSARKDDPLNLDMSDGAYGKMVNAIGSLTADASKNEWICIYTSVEADFDVSEYATTLEYEGRSLTTSGLGISSMSAVKDAVILFRIQTW